MNEAGQTIALVPVREGSKGLPGKNIRPLAGLPLYARSLYQGLRIFGNCVVTTNIDEILNAPNPQGSVILRRPDVLCGDDVPMDAVIRNTIDQLKLQDQTRIVLLQATSPLRTDADVNSALLLHNEKAHDLVLSVTRTDPSILKYGTMEGPDYSPVVRPEYCFANRQDLPCIYRPNGAIFIFSVSAFRRNKGLAAKNIGAIEMPAERSIDIDTLSDFDDAEARLQVAVELATRETKDPQK